MLRKILQLSAVIGLGMLIQSCNTTSDSEEKTESAQGDIVKGSYIFGNEVSSLQPCGSKNELWVKGSQSVMSPLEAKYFSTVEKPYQAVYVSLQGNKLPKATDGFAADYSGQFEVTKVLTLQTEGICP